MFRGNHPAKVDEKGRLKVPAAFKQLLEAQNDTQFYITSQDGKSAEIWPLREWEKREGQLAEFSTLDDAVANIDHVVKIAGIGAVGIGSDFDGVECTPIGLDDVSKYPNLTRALLERGYSADDIRKIYGGNVLRVMRAVEVESARLRAAK